MLLVSACGESAAAVQIANTPLPTAGAKEGNFDVVEIDQTAHRLYLADRDRGVDVFDISTVQAKFIKTIAMPAIPNGLAIAPDLTRLFVGTESGTVVVVDTNAQSATVDTVVAEWKTGGKSADLLDYAAGPHLLFASNGVDGTITSLDPTTGVVKATYKVGYALEQPRFNSSDGMLYVTSPDAAALFRIDPQTGKIKDKLALAGCLPTGLAINPKSNQALIACTTTVISWDLRTAKSENFGQVAGGDVVSYSAKSNRFLVASPQKTRDSAIAIFGGDPIAYVTSVVTDAHGKSAAYDETNDVVYTPDIRPNQAGLTSFRMPAGSSSLPSLLPSLGIFLVLLVAIAVFFFFVGRSADPIRRAEPLTVPKN
jgi:DNA-binding beta-propeller fold protein YncE